MLRDSSLKDNLALLPTTVLLQVQACGSLVTEEQPHAMLIPMEYFLMAYGLYRPYQLNGSPRSPLSPSCISAELLSPESMGLKLKPIKTRVSTDSSDDEDRLLVHIQSWFPSSKAVSGYDKPCCIFSLFYMQYSLERLKSVYIW